MPASLDPPFAPRGALPLKGIAVCRISTEHQDETSLADQEALYRHWLAGHTELRFEMTALASRGSGECLDRAEYLKAIEMVESGKFDLVITEDLGRICRRVHAHLFCELFEDHGVRLIAINDHVDTGRGDWRLTSFFAVMRHEAYNKDTANRIRRSLRNRFVQGGICQFTVFGYVKPPGAKLDSEIRKDPDAERIYDQWFRRLENGATYSEVADWLNAEGVATGPYCCAKKWTCAMVRRITHNPILKGVRVRNGKESRRVNKTGRRRAVPAPPGERLERFCPHLAFIDPAWYDRVIRMLDARNARYRRKGAGGVDNRMGVPKKRTTWPGQHIACGVCGRPCYWTGVGDKKTMMCSGAQNYQCCNSLTFNGAAAARKLSEAVWEEIQALPDFDECFLQILEERLAAGRDSAQARRRGLVRQAEEKRRQIDRVTDAIAASGGNRATRRWPRGRDDR